MTKFEQIKSMNVQELAEKIDKMQFTTNEICIAVTKCPYMGEEGNVSDDCNCVGCIVKWLESEVGEE